MTTNEEECVRILTEIASDKELMNDYLDDGIKARILAAVTMLLGGDYMFSLGSAIFWQLVANKEAN